jgi:pimeloyl-ACP methyl ester carboxylesterase
MNGFRDAFVDTADGARIAYRIRPGRDPWVLVHGLGCDASMWDGVVAALPGEIGIVLPEIRGHGASSLGWRSPSVELWAEDVALVVSAERLPAPAIGGLSMGGYAAFAFAHAHPHLARAYAFVSTSAADDDDAGRLRRAAGLASLRTAGWRAFADGLIPKLLLASHQDFARHRDQLLAMFERAREAGLASALWALAARPDRRAALAAIRRPCAVVVGAHDVLTPPSAAREIAAGLPDARLVVIPGSAHMSAMESPGAVADALLRAGS